MSEKIVKPQSGFIILILLIVILVVGAYFTFSMKNPFIGLAIGFILALTAPGFFIVQPNESKVLTFFGKYVGTVKQNGFGWVNPFYVKKKISLRARNFDSERVKVNDRRGNPIMISVILVWKVEETYKAAFEVDIFESFVKVQTDAAVRKLANSYSYDNFEDHEEEVTLRSGLEEINENLERELDERLAIAGINVIEARIGYLAYAEEIASAMLKRQQAEAIVAARYKIVEGAVGMVQGALEQLSEKTDIKLDEVQRATMVSNLMVVLCSDKDATPVVNAGTLYS
jgi:regulator of protease activity HflC (stomatin/prohibitin superfamily)